jgi:hypothetical protein
MPSSMSHGLPRSQEHLRRQAGCDTYRSNTKQDQVLGDEDIGRDIIIMCIRAGRVGSLTRLNAMEIILHHFETLKVQYIDQSFTQTQRYQDLAPPNLSHQETLLLQSPAEERAIAQNTRRAADRRPVGYQPPSRRTAQPQNPPSW